MGCYCIYDICICSMYLCIYKYANTRYNCKYFWKKWRRSLYRISSLRNPSQNYSATLNSQQKSRAATQNSNERRGPKISAFVPPPNGRDEGWNWTMRRRGDDCCFCKSPGHFCKNLDLKKKEKMAFFLQIFKNIIYAECICKFAYMQISYAVTWDVWEMSL